MLIDESIVIACDPQVIYDYWMDVSNDVHWRAGITKAEWTSPPPYGVGSTGEHTHERMGVMGWEVTAIEPGISFCFMHTSGGMTGSRAFFEVVPEGTGSHVNVQMSISGPLIMRIMMLLMGRTMRNGVRGDLCTLKRLMEGEGAGA